jgi:hypothetical protein
MTAPSNHPHSNHDRHDLELIAAHASGESDPRAVALVENCAECRTEFELQQRVRSWLQAAPSVAMAEHERDALHSRVSQRLAGARSSSRRVPGAWLLPVGAAAAAVAMVAGLSGVLRGGQGAALTMVAGSLAADAGGNVTGEELYAGAAAAEAPATTAAALAAPAARTLPGGDLDAVRAEAEALAAGESDQGMTEAADMSAVPPCLEAIGDSAVIRWATSILDGEPIVIMIVSTDEEAPETRVFVVEDCSPVDL